MIRKLTFTADDSFAGKTVLALLKYNGFSSRLIKQLKKNPHGIIIRNKKVTVLKQLKGGETVTVYIKDESHAEPVDIPIDIVYEDKDVIVCNKPPFMATHPSQNNHGTSLVNALAHHFEKTGEGCTVRPVNRLDKNTSGLILVAKNMYASAQLSDDLKEKRVRREYLAFVEGTPEHKEGRIDAPIARCEDSVIKRCVDMEKGENAVTNYKVEREGEFSLVRLSLETGRTHQIRVHMSYIGTPVASDFLYGTEFSGGLKRHALHSHTLDFVHPVTKEQLHFEAPLPEDMRDLYIKQWGEIDETTGF